MRWAWAGLLVAWAAGPVAAFSGVVTHVTDGDTLWVRADGAAAKAKPLKIRVQGIDAPERCQAWGPQAGEALARRVLHRRVEVQTKARDDYHRSIARVSMQGEDIGAWMVVQGHAWSDHWRRREGAYGALEAQARAARRGLFSQPDAIEPKVFRRMHGACVASKH